MVVQEIVFQIARRRVKGFSTTPSSPEATSSPASYRKWREETLESEFLQNFGPDLVKGKDVLDFGCGDGALSFVMAGLGARSCVGLDLTQRDIDFANTQVKDEPITFKCSSSTSAVDLDDQSIDVIACFDVMEHIMEYKEIMKEWARILRPGGKVLIHWQPYFHPYGHHAHAYIPIPWVHVVLNSRGFSEVCARIVELPEFDAPYWDYDESGRRINRFQIEIDSGLADKPGHLNELTMLRFERLCREIGLRIERRTLESFSGPKVVQTVSGLMKRIPGVREFFTANAIYILAR